MASEDTLEKSIEDNALLSSSSSSSDTSESSEQQVDTCTNNDKESSCTSTLLDTDESYAISLDMLENINNEETIENATSPNLIHQIEEDERRNEELLNENLLREYLHQEMTNEKLEILINILPDADPNFLRDFIEKNDETMSLQQFVESNLINGNYKKRDECYAKRRNIEKIKQYTTDFHVQHFIKLFPEPFEYFESNARTVTYKKKAFNFLKTRYNSLPEQNLLDIYSSNKFNLSLTDKQVLSMNSFVTTELEDFYTDDVELLQEIAFIQNKDTIKLYFDDMKQREEQELQILREENLLLSCQCCGDELKPTEFNECENNHVFCRTCIIRGTNVVISNGQNTVLCFFGCGKEISLNVLQNVLPESTYEILLKKRQEAEIAAAQLDDLVTCPFCPFQMELAPQIIIFICKNPECMKITCRLCKKINHLPTQCENVLDDKERQFVEEEMSKALIRKCYGCHKPFVKYGGCNKMTCYCGAVMCYICRKPISNYDHFEKEGGCKTHQDSDIFDQDQLEITRIQATLKLGKNVHDL